MSGGSFGTPKHFISFVASALETAAQDPLMLNHYPEEVIVKFSKTAHLLRECAWRVREIDLLLSHDNGVETFLENWHDHSIRELMRIAHDMVPLKGDKSC